MQLARMSLIDLILWLWLFLNMFFTIQLNYAVKWTHALQI